MNSINSSDREKCKKQENDAILKFLFEDGLFKKWEYSQDNWARVFRELSQWRGQRNMHCPKCEEQSSFLFGSQAQSGPGVGQGFNPSLPLLFSNFAPDRREEEVMKKHIQFASIPGQCLTCHAAAVVFIRGDAKGVIKTYQSPGKEDALAAELKGWKSVISGEETDGYRKTIRSSENGFHVGAVAYIRGLFERMLERIASTEIETNRLEVGQWSVHLKMKDKLQLLEEPLVKLGVPIDILKHFYGSASNDLHELDEEGAARNNPLYLSTLKLVYDSLAKEALLGRNLEKVRKAYGNLSSQKGKDSKP